MSEADRRKVYLPDVDGFNHAGVRRPVEESYTDHKFHPLSVASLSNFQKKLFLGSIIMDRTAVTSFLARVSLAQRLPTSSLLQIADVLVLRTYGKGDYVVREGEHNDGAYFILEGEAEVCGFDNAEENWPVVVKKKYDFFGYGTGDSVHQANVVALSKLDCLVLRNEHHNLLQTKSIWNKDDRSETHSVVENVMCLDHVEVDVFRGSTLPGTPKFAQVFGGQLIGQALAAASKTVDCLKLVHSLHGYFLLAADLTNPIIYKVHRARDGKSFAARRVDAIQKGLLRFTLLAAFQKEEEGFEHQDFKMPSVPAPETLLTMEELPEKSLYDPHLPRQYRDKDAGMEFSPRPIDIRICEQGHSLMMYWFKAKGKLSDDPALHRCVVAYASDLLFFEVCLLPHGGKGIKTASLSLDHSMWFHRPFRADDWLLFVIHSPTTSNARGFCIGRMFNRKGELVISVSQEGVIRKAKAPLQSPQAKL